MKSFLRFSDSRGRSFAAIYIYIFFLEGVILRTQFGVF